MIAFKRKHLSIKWGIFAGLLVFLAILLLLLFLLQTVYLDDIYKAAKKNTLNNANAKVVQILEGQLESLVTLATNQSQESNAADEEGIANTVPSDEDVIRAIEQQLDQVTVEYDIDIQVSREDGTLLYSSLRMYENTLPKQFYQDSYKRAEENGGSFTEEIAGDIQRDPFELLTGNEEPPEKPTGEENEAEQLPPNENPGNGIGSDQTPPSSIEQESMVSVRILTISSTPYLTILSARLTPVNATVQMIRQELIFVSIIMIILALVLAMVISRLISKPLSQMNESAKELAKGNYDVEFHDQSSLEISELGSTLNYTARQLKKTEQLQHELIANVSHDLRTPLTMIQAYAEMMRDIPGENTPENVQVIIDEAGHLTGMVNDLLDISKLQAGVTQLNKTHFNLTANLEAAVQRIGRMASANEFAIELICDQDQEVFVDADEFKIYQVVYNLINNALNYSGDSRHIIVRQECTSDTVKVSVQDFGPGIAKENLPLVWERYYKVDKEHRRSSNGSGLGLAIVRKILELHHAQYGVDSTLGQGSTFWFCLKGTIRKREDI
jgi:signal transduction histidine kinase